MAKNTDNKNVRKFVIMSLSIAFQLFILENSIISTKKFLLLKLGKGINDENLSEKKVRNYQFYKSVKHDMNIKMEVLGYHSGHYFGQ